MPYNCALMPIVEKRNPHRQSPGSTLNAGQNLSITATGKNKDSPPDAVISQSSTVNSKPAKAYHCLPH
ncbi:hypothetical protein ACDV62_19745, partial [Proteus mirabilis]|uniref:hypothetical protein n=1 Tax=Proteus mirabilis TaxID=584 RepID=UPI003557C2A4